MPVAAQPSRLVGLGLGSGLGLTLTLTLTRCPWQRNLLASGGGTADRTIRFWNSNSGVCLNAVDTRSQACNRGLRP